MCLTPLSRNKAALMNFSLAACDLAIVDDRTVGRRLFLLAVHAFSEGVITVISWLSNVALVVTGPGGAGGRGGGGRACAVAKLCTEPFAVPNGFEASTR